VNSANCGLGEGGCLKLDLPKSGKISIVKMYLIIQNVFNYSIK